MKEPDVKSFDNYNFSLWCSGFVRLCLSAIFSLMDQYSINSSSRSINGITTAVTSWLHYETRLDWDGFNGFEKVARWIITLRSNNLPSTRLQQSVHLSSGTFLRVMPHEHLVVRNQVWIQGHERGAENVRALTAVSIVYPMWFAAPKFGSKGAGASR